MCADIYQMSDEERTSLTESPPEGERIAPAGVELLKRTYSVCPRCFNVVAADVGVEDRQVWMYKRCDEHGAFKGRIESRVDFYRAVMNTPPVQRKPCFSLVVPFTHRCNLDCSLCYVPKRDRDDLTLEQTKEVVDSFPGVYIGVSGGEPTLREDLPDLVRHIRSTGRGCQILTNGLRLADRAYVRELVDAGLHDYLLSFNGLSDEVYQQIHGEPLLDLKLRALENLVEEGALVCLSPTIFRGVNEEEIAPLIDLCLEKAPSVYELRVRGACRVGTHVGVTSQVSSAEVLEVLSDAMGRDVPGLLAELDRDACYHSIIQFNMLAAFLPEERGRTPVAWNSGVYMKDASDEAMEEDLRRKVSEGLAEDVPDLAGDERFTFLQINSWGWPDAHNLDFQEIHSHGVFHLYDNSRPVNFCEAVLRSGRL